VSTHSGVASPLDQVGSGPFVPLDSLTCFLQVAKYSNAPSEEQSPLSRRIDKPTLAQTWKDSTKTTWCDGSAPHRMSWWRPVLCWTKSTRHSDTIREPAIAYTLGRIAGHNVVLASLPPGYYGSTSAAVVLRDLLRSFPAFKFGLLVGIGGGVCSQTQDVRLGDVVVSTPSLTSPGVIQFDLGKALSQGIFQHTGVLNKPPIVLLRPIPRLQARHEMNDPEFGRYILEALTGNLV
jgi:hypothetical protein